mmetsp:Transcript_96656/g.152943  ORF Transcript_96656/g.152943 Transcript_96656/m.152943 type:complete len:228 (+) Transcript_96656:381-1064(+)
MEDMDLNDDRLWRSSVVSCTSTSAYSSISASSHSSRKATSLRLKAPLPSVSKLRNKASTSPLKPCARIFFRNSFLATESAPWLSNDSKHRSTLPYSCWAHRRYSDKLSATLASSSHNVMKPEQFASKYNQAPATSPVNITLAAACLNSVQLTLPQASRSIAKRHAANQCLYFFMKARFNSSAADSLGSHIKNSCGVHRSKHLMSFMVSSLSLSQSKRLNISSAFTGH